MAGFRISTWLEIWAYIKNKESFGFNCTDYFVKICEVSNSIVTMYISRLKSVREHLKYLTMSGWPLPVTTDNHVNKNIEICYNYFARISLIYEDTTVMSSFNSKEKTKIYKDLSRSRHFTALKPNL